MTFTTRIIRNFNVCDLVDRPIVQMKACRPAETTALVHVLIQDGAGDCSARLLVREDPTYPLLVLVLVRYVVDSSG
eukprot:scaffold226314_cov15-Prasinocladus_malaysianus.AAC.1